MLDLKNRPKKALHVPARSLARMVAFAKEAKLPRSWGPMLAEAMTPETAEALKEDLVNAMEVLESQDMPADEEALDLIRKAIEAISAGLDDGEDGEEVERPITAHLVKSIVAKQRAANPMSHSPRRGPSRVQVGMDYNSPQAFTAKMTDAFTARLAARMGQKHEPVIGREFANLTVAQMAMQSLHASGVNVGSEREAIQHVMSGTHTGSDFPGIIRDGLTSVVSKGIEVAPPALLMVSNENDSIDYRDGFTIGLSASSMPSKVNEGGEIRYVTIDETGESKPVPEDHAAIFRVSNQAMQNDSTALGLFGNIGRKMIEGALGRQRAVMLAPLLENSGLGQNMRNGKTMFHADHGNIAPVGSSLDILSLNEARVKMRRQKGLQGELLPITPFALIVPPELETTGQKVLAELLAAKVDDVNPFSGQLELVVEPGLEDPSAWYLAGDPAMYDGLAHTYLDGGSSPRIESKEGWDTLGMEFRLVWAIGAAFVATQSWYLNEGE